MKVNSNHTLFKGKQTQPLANHVKKRNTNIEDSQLEFDNETDTDESYSGESIQFVKDKLNKVSDYDLTKKSVCQEQQQTLDGSTLSKVYGAGLKLLKKMGYKGGGLNDTVLINPIKVAKRRTNMGIKEGESGIKLQNEEKLSHNLEYKFIDESKRIVILKKKYKESKFASLHRLRSSIQSIEWNMKNKKNNILIEISKTKLTKAEKIKLQEMKRIKVSGNTILAAMENLRRYFELSENTNEESYKNDINLLINENKIDKSITRTSKVIYNIGNITNAFTKLYNFDQSAFVKLNVLDLFFYYYRIQINNHLQGIKLIDIDELLEKLSLVANFVESIDSFYKKLSLPSNYYEYLLIYNTKTLLNTFSVFYTHEIDLLNYKLCKNTLDILSTVVLNKFSEKMIGQVIVIRLVKMIKDCKNPEEFIELVTKIHPWINDFPQYKHLPINNIINMFNKFKEKCFKINTVHLDMLNAIKPYLSPQDIQMILNTTVMPHLTSEIQKYGVNPKNQQTEHIDLLYEYKELIGVESIVYLTNTYILPRWLRTLYEWLNMDNFSKSEIAIWYNGWKNLIPPQIMNDPSVSIFFTQALSMLSHATLGNLNKEFESYLSEAINFNTLKNAAELASNQNKGSILNTDTISGRRKRLYNLFANSTFSTNNNSQIKDHIQEIAAENNILMKLVDNRTENGKSIYQFGKLYIYTDNFVIHYKSNTNWIPITIDELVRVAQLTK